MLAVGAPFILVAGPGTVAAAAADDDGFAVAACSATPPSEGGATMTATGQNLSYSGICLF